MEEGGFDCAFSVSEARAGISLQRLPEPLDAHGYAVVQAPMRPADRKNASRSRSEADKWAHFMPEF